MSKKKMVILGALSSLGMMGHDILEDSMRRTAMLPRNKKHWKEEQSEEERNEKLQKAEEKRKRKAEKRNKQQG